MERCRASGGVLSSTETNRRDGDAEYMGVGRDETLGDLYKWAALASNQPALGERRSKQAIAFRCRLLPLSEHRESRKQARSLQVSTELKISRSYVPLVDTYNNKFDY
jgi:hypothetical protein